MPLIEARNLCKYFHLGRPAEVRAVDDVNLSLEPSTFTAFVGPSGSGKTTLLTLLAALDQPTSGSVLLEGVEMSKCSDVERTRARRRFGLIFPEYDFLPRLSLLDNISYTLIPRRIARSRRREVVVGLLDRLGLQQHERKRPDELSRGERQRANIVRALAGHPEIVFADEPTSNLDRDTADAVISLLGEIHSAGTTILVATHDPDLLAQATVVVRIEAGKVLTATDS